MNLSTATPSTVPTRKRNPRRVLIEMLKMPRSRITWIHQTFTGITRDVYDPEVRDESGSALRGRRPDEYPENDSGIWSDVYTQAYAAVRELNEIMTYAKAQHGGLCARTKGQ